MEFKTIWSSSDWELKINDDDSFKIIDMMTGDSLTIELDDKAEFLELINRLKVELEAEDFECFDK